MKPWRGDRHGRGGVTSLTTLVRNGLRDVTHEPCVERSVEIDQLRIFRRGRVVRRFGSLGLASGRPMETQAWG